MQICNIIGVVATRHCEHRTQCQRQRPVPRQSQSQCWHVAFAAAVAQQNENSPENSPQAGPMYV